MTEVVIMFLIGALGTACAFGAGLGMFLTTRMVKRETEKTTELEEKV